MQQKGFEPENNVHGGVGEGGIQKKILYPRREKWQKTVGNTVVCVLNYTRVLWWSNEGGDQHGQIFFGKNNKWTADCTPKTWKDETICKF